MRGKRTEAWKCGTEHKRSDGLTIVECRPELARFVRMLEGQLTTTDYREHWRTTGATHEYVKWLVTEARELCDSFNDDVKPHVTIREALDVAALAMMVADRLLEGLE